VRHNLRLIVEASKADLDGLAREARLVEERKKVIGMEELRLSKKVEEEADREILAFLGLAALPLTRHPWTL
jgi:tuftelin-interacting protein 11